MKPLTHRAARLAVLTLLAAASAACFSSQTLIKLHPDGSGTIEQTNLVNTAMIGMAAGMAKQMAGQNGQAGAIPKTEDLFSEEQLKGQASQMGAGVRFVSSEKITENGMQGARAVYAFDHVDTLTMGGNRARRESPNGASAPQMQFGFSKPSASASRLTVSFPDQRGTGAASETAAAPRSPQPMPDIPPEAMAMVKSMFEGARIGVDVEVDGRIVKTNAPFTNGSRVTLIEVDFGQLLSDPSKFQTLQTLKPGVDFQTVRKTLEGAKGVKIPLEPTVTIDFAR